METILMVLHVAIALGLIGLVMIQHGKGADAGAAFGSGASATVFGARGAGSFLTRTTAILAALFFANSLLLAYMASSKSEPVTLMEQVTPAVQQSAPIESVPAVPETDQGAPSAAPSSDVPAVN
ncbi:MAG: preprotein translocase subunit SecG [Chromatiales bacterium]|nr:preprotein translocase subunit SecG [Chromatiales bacterium]